MKNESVVGPDALTGELATSRPSHRLSSALLAVPLVVIGLGNLVLPEPAQALLPVDYLLLTLALCGAVSLYRLRRVVSRLSMLTPLVLFFAGCLVGVLSSTASSYAQNKFLTFGIIALLATATATATSQLALQRAVGISLLIVGVATSAALITLGSVSPLGRATLFDLNPIGLARATGLATVISVALLFSGGPRRRSRLFWVGLLAVALLGSVATVLTGSRGPFVSIAAALAVVLVASLHAKRLRLATVATLGVTLIAGYLAVVLFGGQGLGRLESGVDSGRALLYSQTWEVIRSRPWTGVGWGNFPLYIFDFSSDDGTLYPHNILLELWVEGGIPALVGFLILCVAAFARQFRAARDATWTFVMLAVLTFSLTNALFSSDVVGNRLMWLLLVVGLLSVERSTKRGTGIDSTRRGPLRPA